ncbi:MAG: hypothetical protein GY805_02315 [Chloroflexi bacterium]|nr:hypothetical protein [Chloroflexota bacterium]
MAQLALSTDQPQVARSHAQQAHNLATCDGPPYTYKPALDEAERLLAEIS